MTDYKSLINESTSAMPNHGGHREGGGRKKGSRDKKSRTRKSNAEIEAERKYVIIYFRLPYNFPDRSQKRQTTLTSFVLSQKEVETESVSDAEIAEIGSESEISVNSESDSVPKSPYSESDFSDVNAIDEGNYYSN